MAMSLSLKITEPFRQGSCVQKFSRHGAAPLAIAMPHLAVAFSRHDGKYLEICLLLAGSYLVPGCFNMEVPVGAL